MKRKIYSLALILSLTVFLSSWTYYKYFSEALNNSAWRGVYGFTRIIIPDTFLYLHIIDYSDPIMSMVVSGVKNTIGPSLIWFMTNGNWVLTSLVNSILLFIGLMYFANTAQLFGVRSRKIRSIMVLLALLPATLYYSVGALKEIPTLVFLSGFFYHYLQREHIKWLLFAMLLVLFRYQLGASLLLFIVADQFNKRSLNIVILVLIFIAAVFPYLQEVSIFTSGATEYYRAVFGVESSIGGMIEFVRDTVPGVSLFAVLIRIFQTIFEPFLTFFRNPTFYEYGDISILTVTYVVSQAMLLRYWLSFMKRIGLIIRNQNRIPRNIKRLYMLCLVAVVPIAGFSFIHHRYLYPVTALVILASIIPLDGMLRHRQYLTKLKNKVVPE